MNGRIWSDDELDALMRAEFSRMAVANPAPPVRDVRVSDRRRLRLPVFPWSAAPDHPRRLAPLAAGLAMAVAFAGAGAWIGTHRLGGGVSQPAHGGPPTLRPAPSDGATLRSTVPPGVDVVYSMTVQTDQRVEMEAVDWSGRHVGHITVTQAGGHFGGGGIDQSPSGQTLQVGPDLFTAQGSWLGRPWTDVIDQPRWGDDRTLCDTPQPDSTGGKAQLRIYTSGVGWRVAANLVEPGYVYSCSVQDDRAVIVSVVPGNSQQPSSSASYLSASRPGR